MVSRTVRYTPRPLRKDGLQVSKVRPLLSAAMVTHGARHASRSFDAITVYAKSISGKAGSLQVTPSTTSSTKVAAEQMHMTTSKPYAMNAIRLKHNENQDWVGTRGLFRLARY